jgi:putative Holliday junction resolvase
VVTRGRSRRQDYERIAALVVEEEAEIVVVGMPRSLSGGEGPAARAAAAEIAALASVVGVPVETHDERFTTVTATRALAESGVRGPARRQVVDKVAAAVILQSWAGRPPELFAMSIADELAREREAARRPSRTARRDVSRARGIDDVDSLDELDMLDWSTDPWDEALAAGSVERLRWQTRSIKWVAYSLLVVGMGGRPHRRCRRLVVHPPGEPGG